MTCLLRHVYVMVTILKFLFIIQKDDFSFSQHVRVPLSHGSLLLMLGSTQHDWQHRLPKEYHDRGARVNLTFRTMSPKHVVPLVWLPLPFCARQDVIFRLTIQWWPQCAKQETLSRTTLLQNEQTVACVQVLAPRDDDDARAGRPVCFRSDSRKVLQSNLSFTVVHYFNGITLQRIRNVFLYKIFHKTWCPPLPQHGSWVDVHASFFNWCVIVEFPC